MLYSLHTKFTNRSLMKSDLNEDLHATTAVRRDQNAVAQEQAGTSEVRSEVVARARELIADANYPDAAVIEKIAQHLASNLQRPPADK
jgi:hypothetical protein